MWPFNRKSKPANEPHPALVQIAEQADAARNERSNTVAAFVRRMRELEGGYDPEHERREGHAD